MGREREQVKLVIAVCILHIVQRVCLVEPMGHFDVKVKIRQTSDHAARTLPACRSDHNHWSHPVPRPEPSAETVGRS
ncbi:hypothetical protein F5141DRAFT_1075885 [Pisolithus sp. B1]|nr:hypothetical protein F5141DRAFT_1075885 [Pisolithus sp. B1]